MQVLQQFQVINWLKNTAVIMKENKEYLSDLDSPIGDADHGINMDRGFTKVLTKLDEFEKLDIGSILKNTGMTLISSVGGAAGPLYGTFYLKAGMALSGKMEITLDELSIALEKGLEGIKARGRAMVGEKTIIDSLEPAIKSLKAATTKNKSIEEALNNSLDAAEKGMNSTIDLIAKKGRASYLGERSLGHQDPGATSAFFIMKALNDATQQNS